MRPETLKARLKAEMVWGSLVRGRFKESLQVGEKDVNDAAREGGDATQADAFEYKLRPIVLIVPRGSAPAAMDQRRKEAESLRERVQAATRPIPTSSRCRTPRSARPSSRPRPTFRVRCASCSTRRRSVILDSARDHQARRRDGGVVRAQTDQGRHPEEAGNPGKDVRREIRGEAEVLPERPAQSRDDPECR